MDVGASTGGFTDCMLQQGAARVYSVDVGRGQLAPVLRQDPRVICMEQTNFRYMTREDLQEQPAFISVDVSFNPPRPTYRRVSPRTSRTAPSSTKQPAFTACFPST